VPRVVVIGAGIAGLTVAYRLLRLATGPDVEVTVLEQSPRVGGNLHTETIAGFLCERGPNGFLDNAPDTLALVGELGLEPIASDDRARKRYIYRRGRLHLVPDSPGGFLRSQLLSWPGKVRILAEPFAPRRPEGDETIHDFAARRLGKEAADAMVDPMVSGIFGGDASRLSLRAAFPKMWELETVHGGLFRALWARRAARRESGAPVGSPFGRLTSFAEGIETLPRALALALGPRVRTGVGASTIRRVGMAADRSIPPWRVITNHGEAIDADHVVLTGPPLAASRVVDSIDAGLASALGAIQCAPIAVVALGYDIFALNHPLDGFGFLAPRGEGIRVLGALWDSSIYPNRAPRGHALIRMMVGGAHDPGIVYLDDDALVQIARKDLRLAMGVDALPKVTHVVRHPVGIPQYTVGHLDRLATIDRALANLPGLHLTGNGYRGVAINHCIAEANTVAARVLAAGAGSSIAA
jgi:protoporphyrinogen/coproporphyrinogen III oxidase